jgi:predicted membrane metal-binding protein
LILILTVLFSMIFLSIHCVLLNGCLDVGLLGALLLSCLCLKNNNWWVLPSVLAMLRSLCCGQHLWMHLLVGIPLMHGTKGSFCMSLEDQRDVDCLGGFGLFCGFMQVGSLEIKV